MNKILASAGMLALGITGVKAADSGSTGSDKPWTVSASLRGFYDDNYALANTNRQDSFGFEINPKIGVTLPDNQQTTAGANYSYTLRYFEDRSEDVDHTHEFSGWLAHQFTERFSANLRDDLVYSEEPTLTQPGGGVIRTEGTALHNKGQIGFQAQLTQLVGLVLGYRNELYDYRNPSYAGVLDRWEHYANLDVTWTVSPQTVFLTGYQIGFLDYTGNGVFSLPGGGAADIDIKNAYSHYGYVGVQHTFTPNLTGSLKGGVRYNDYFNVPNGAAGLDDQNIGPYVQGSLRYNFLPDSFLEVGVAHDLSASDLSTLGGDSTVGWTALSHSFTPKFVGKVMGQVQNTDYSELDQTEWIYLAKVGLEYHITENVSVNVEYNYDHVNSDDKSRTYDRNRVFLGVTASY